MPSATLSSYIALGFASISHSSERWHTQQLARVQIRAGVCRVGRASWLLIPVLGDTRDQPLYAKGTRHHNYDDGKPSALGVVQQQSKRAVHSSSSSLVGPQQRTGPRGRRRSATTFREGPALRHLGDVRSLVRRAGTQRTKPTYVTTTSTSGNNATLSRRTCEGRHNNHHICPGTAPRRAGRAGPRGREAPLQHGQPAVVVLDDSLECFP